MACPTVEIVGKTVILLNGFHKLPWAAGKLLSESGSIKIEALERLRKSTTDHPDAMAFGFVAGRWVPAA